MTSLADITRPDVRKHGIVLVPIGSTEQHGPHLPLDTDTVIAKAVSERAVALLDGPQVLVTPALAFGSSGENQSFPGTVSIGTETLRLVIAHGGNVTALNAAVGQLQAEGPAGASAAQGDLVLESMASNVADQVRTAAGVG
jgi:mycofactocin precursor peptide peptidase